MVYPSETRYRKKALLHVSLDLNRNTEPDLVEMMESVPNKSRYLKRLIRDDIERKRKENE